MLPQLYGTGADMAKKDDDAVLTALREAMGGNATRRSRLDRWMTANYDEFADLLKGQRPNWAAITEVFEHMGFGEGGKPMGPETVRQTWWRVRARRGDLKKPRKSKPETAGLAPGIVREVLNTPSDRKQRVLPVSPVSPTVPVRSVELVRVRGEQSDPDAVMRALDEQLNAGRPKMPKPIK